MELNRIEYKDLNSKQKEIYNFQKVAGILADYGYNCIKLTDDWQGADFLAYHKDGDQTLKVQLKARCTVDPKYLGKDIYIAFPNKGKWYLIPHDTLARIAGDYWPRVKRTYGSDEEQRPYSSANPNRKMLARLTEFRIESADRSERQASVTSPGN